VHGLQCLGDKWLMNVSAETEPVILNKRYHVLSDYYTGDVQKNGAVQKLIRNLFLTLRKHNVHRQQRQLSKFLMR
jgi:hypothetical protein